VLDEKWPLTYLQIYGPAAVEDYLKTTVDVMMKWPPSCLGSHFPRRRGRSSRPKPAKSAAW